MAVSQDLQTILAQLEPIAISLQVLVKSLRDKIANGAWSDDDKVAAQALVDKFKTILT